MHDLANYIQRSPLTATLNQDDAIYIAPHIPQAKLHGALGSYIPAGINPNDILILMDDTVFGSAREGLALTHSHLYCKEIMDKPGQFALGMIQSIHYASGFLNGGLYLNNQRVTGLTQPSNNSLKLFAQLVSGFITEQASRPSARINPASTGYGQPASPDPFAPPHPFSRSPQGQSSDAFSRALPLLDVLIFLALLKTGQWNTASVRYIRHCFRDIPAMYQDRLDERMKQSPFNLTVTVEQLGQMLPNLGMESRKLLVKWSIQLMLINEFTENEFDQYLHILATTLGLNRHDINAVMDHTEITCAADWQ